MPAVIRELRAVLPEAEIVVVDDGSSDGTAAAAERAGARVLRHRFNRGYGAALKTGILAAAHDTIVILDGDGTYPAQHIPALVAELEKATMAVGARGGSDSAIPAARRPAKRMLNGLASLVAGARIPDLNSGLRAFRRQTVEPYFPILPDGFSWTTTITLALVRDRQVVSYLPIGYRERIGRAKLGPWDTWRILLPILRAAWRRRGP